MQIQLSKKELVRHLNTVKRAIPKKCIAPVLDAVHVVATKAPNSRIKFTTYNLDWGIEVKPCGTVDEPGLVALPVNELLAAVRKMPKNDLTIAVDESDKATITDGKVKVCVQGMPSSEFPPVPLVFPDRTVNMYGYELGAAVEMVKHAARRDDVLTPYYQCLAFTVSPDKTEITAGDGYRLASTTVTSGSTNHFQFLLHADVCDHLGEIFKDEIVTIEVQRGKHAFYNQAVFWDDRVKLTTVLKECEYPMFDTYLKVNSPCQFSVECTALSQAIQYVAPARHNGTIPLRLHLGDGELRVSCEQTSRARAVTATILSGSAGVFVDVNPTYFRQAVDAIPCRYVTIGIGEAWQRITLHHESDSNHRQLVMPMYLPRSTFERRSALMRG